MKHLDKELENRKLVYNWYNVPNNRPFKQSIYFLHESEVYLCLYGRNMYVCEIKIRDIIIVTGEKKLNIRLEKTYKVLEIY